MTANVLILSCSVVCSASLPSQDGLVFDCVTDGDSFTIRKCVVESFEFPDMPGMENEEEAEADLEDLDEAMEPYRGPIFENLDPELQARHNLLQ